MQILVKSRWTIVTEDPKRWSKASSPHVPEKTPWAGDSSPTNLMPFGKKLIFRARTMNEGYELLISELHPLIKTGAVGGERTAKLNELVRISEELGSHRAKMAQLP